MIGYKSFDYIFIQKKNIMELSEFIKYKNALNDLWCVFNNKKKNQEKHLVEKLWKNMITKKENYIFNETTTLKNNKVNVQGLTR